MSFVMPHNSKRPRMHHGLDATSAGQHGCFAHYTHMVPHHTGGMQAMQRIHGTPPNQSASSGTVRMMLMPHGRMQDSYAHLGGVSMMPAKAPVAVIGISNGFPSVNEEIETLIKMVLNAIIVQSEDEVFVPFGIAKKDGAAKGAASAVSEEGEGGENGHVACGGEAPEEHGAQGTPDIHDGAQSLGDECAHSGHGCAGAEGHGGEGSEEGAASDNTLDARDGGAVNSPDSDMGTRGQMGKGRKGKENGGVAAELTPDLFGILRACLKKIADQTEASLKKHVNKVLKAAPFHMAVGPLYYYTPDTPRNELERAERTPVVRGWAFRDALTEERVLREGLCRIPAIYRVHQDDNAHCKAAMDALDMATQIVRPLPHKKAMRGRRMKGSRGFKSLPAKEADRDYEPGSETWAWKRFGDGRLQWCDRKERRWFKCSQCRFMRENRAQVKAHFEASCQEAWEQEQRSRPQEAAGEMQDGRCSKAPRLSHAHGGGRGSGANRGQTPPPLLLPPSLPPPRLPDTHIKALILIDTLLGDGTLSPKQAERMRWLCMWRQPPIAVLMLAYGTNPELFAIRCTLSVACPVLLEWCPSRCVLSARLVFLTVVQCVSCLACWRVSV